MLCTSALASLKKNLRPLVEWHRSLLDLSWNCLAAYYCRLIVLRIMFIVTFCTSVVEVLDTWPPVIQFLMATTKSCHEWLTIHNLQSLKGLVTER